MNEATLLRHHYVNPEPFDPGATEPVGAHNEQFDRASSWKLTWWKFRRHKVAVASALILLAFYLIPSSRCSPRTIRSSATANSCTRRRRRSTCSIPGCSACGSRNVKTQPDWTQSEWVRKHGR